MPAVIVVGLIALLILFLIICARHSTPSSDSRNSSIVSTTKDKNDEIQQSKTEQGATPQVIEEKLLNYKCSDTIKYLNERHVSKLVHFTKAENTLSIFTHGIIPNCRLEEIGKEGSINDPYRFDRHRDANCLSIEFPNYKMFYSLRQQTKKDWMVLCIKPEVLDQYRVVFFQTNAASNSMRDSRQPFDKKLGLESMFASTVNGISRNQTGIPSNYTTDPQAEVLVFGTIRPEFISGVVFENEKAMEHWKYLIPKSVHTYVDSMLFSGRIDWRYWKKESPSNSDYCIPDLSELDEYDYGYGADQTKLYDD